MTPAEERFWALAEAISANAHVTRSTMMGLPCLRWDGQFFASSTAVTTHLSSSSPKLASMN